MHLMFLIAATIGCTLLAVQVVLQVIGLDHDGGAAELHADAAAHGAETNVAFGLLSFKSLTAFAAFFGLTGLAAEELGVESQGLQIVLSTVAGLLSMGVVVLLMRGVAALHASGTVKLEEAVGRPGTVYLRIPGHNGGTGKINVVVGGRELELLAMTPGPQIPTGAMVEVVRQINSNTFEVTRTQ